MTRFANGPETKWADRWIVVWWIWYILRGLFSSPRTAGRPSKHHRGGWWISRSSSLLGRTDGVFQVELTSSRASSAMDHELTQKRPIAAHRRRSSVSHTFPLLSLPDLSPAHRIKTYVSSSLHTHALRCSTLICFNCCFPSLTSEERKNLPSAANFNTRISTSTD